ncbi:MAG: hypothetical protein KI793_08830 [Rivularia sp. (in: Bacteria)]|nr:hypothetical protein [Rivularia sp. MS3]
MIESFFGMILGLVFIGFSAVAVGAEELQTEITEEDLLLINKLVRIAQKKSYQVREVKYEMGFNAFVDIVSIELSPSQSRTNYKTPDFSSEDERSFSISFTIDPVKIFTAIDKMPVMKARLRETKQQTRLRVMKQYLAYLQARQANKIAAYQMHKFEKRERIAASNLAVGNSRQLDNADYVAVATNVLDKNIQERLALEELADVVGLSAKEITNILAETSTVRRK